MIARGDSSPPGFGDPASGTAAPGERAPHLWFSHNGRRRSTVDLFDGRLTLIVGPRGRGWRRAAARLADTSLPLVALTAGREIADPDGRLAHTYRVGQTDAVLVRPDGFVAWRSDTAAADPDTTWQAPSRSRWAGCRSPTPSPVDPQSPRNARTVVGRRRTDAKLDDPIASMPVEYTKKPLLPS